ncbi:MAG: hypothetical protein KF729_19180 [Sandaracinaceae bacterium]|nr:hypothetical protein [Sandaracinaceae bacterium]
MTARRTRPVVAIALFMLSAAGAAAFFPLPTPEPWSVDWRAHAAGPVDSRHVYWVGHSLVNARDARVEPSFDLMQAVGRLAEAAGLAYASFDHTLFGAPLSLLVRGRPHSYERDAPEMPARLEGLRRGAARYDTLVLTEGLPVGRSLEREHGAYYAQELYCALVARRPDARVYVYESWGHLHASDPDGDYPSPSVYDWRARLRADRAHWERLADLAATGAVPPPGLLARPRARFAPAHGCTPPGPIFLVPVGAAFGALADRLAREPLSLGERTLAIADLFSNPYTSWPEGWPRATPLAPAAEAAALAGLTRRFPADELDDIHPSALGIYLAALVHYATLYRRSPEGLPALVPLPEATNRALQRLAWDVVRAEPRAGVR